MPGIAGIAALMKSGHGRRGDNLGERLSMNGLNNFFMQFLDVLDGAAFGFVS